MITQEWKDIPGFEGRYQVSSVGKVRSLMNNSLQPRKVPLVLKDRPTGDRYRKVYLSVKNRRYNFTIHRLVLLTFTGTPNVGQQCAHLNGIRDDNRLENLKWVSPKENAAHKWLHGTQQTGEAAPNVKLSNWDAITILNLHFVHAKGYSEISRLLNLNPPHVVRIVKGRNFKSIYETFKKGASFEPLV